MTIHVKAMTIAVIAITCLLSVPMTVEARHAGKTYRIGYLASGKPARYTAPYAAIQRALHNLGYIEGQTVTSVYRYAEGRRGRLPAVAAELARDKVDIIVAAGGDTLIRAAKNATRTIPIVMTGPGSNPVEAGLIASLARPGGNVTGVTNFNTALGGKRLALLKDAVPKLAHVAVLYDPTVPGTTREVREHLPMAARALKLMIRPWAIRRADDFDGVFAALNKERPDGDYVTGVGSVINSNAKRIADLALNSRLPAVYTNIRAVNAGGLIYYGADLADSYRRVAYYVDKILKGTKPADMPVEQPTKFYLVVNLMTAKALGITIPPSILSARRSGDRINSLLDNAPR